ncbi:hypothetical protein RX799_24780 [Klebsiella oxytoca]|uniref:hypothetical protein n=1 Tax=Klebsiella oxytoca TaxID=571 RepID=UPI00384EC415
MSMMTIDKNDAGTATQQALQQLTQEPGMTGQVRSRFHTWLQAQFDRHYHTLRDGGYRRFLAQSHPAELERYDAVCEALRREEFTRFAELQTLGLFLHLQVAEKEAQFRRRRNRFLMAMSVTGAVTSAALWAHFHEAQFMQLCHQVLSAGQSVMQMVASLL